VAYLWWAIPLPLVDEKPTIKLQTTLVRFGPEADISHSSWLHASGLLVGVFKFFGVRISFPAQPGHRHVPAVLQRDKNRIWIELTPVSFVIDTDN
jgi:hypothetical protein